MIQTRTAIILLLSTLTLACTNAKSDNGTNNNNTSGDSGEIDCHQKEDCIALYGEDHFLDNTNVECMDGWCTECINEGTDIVSSDDCPEDFVCVYGEGGRCIHNE